jgi:prepilin-type N-terminal cleavage/methylation domain-containing protein
VGGYGVAELRPPALANARRSGFTLIELLAAMAILVIITLIVSQLFQQANVAWGTGLKKAESTMTGRALADYIAQDLAGAVRDDTQYPEFQASASTLAFWRMDEASGARRAINYVIYSSGGGGGLTRTVKDAPSGVQLESSDLVGSGVTLEVQSVAGGAGGTVLPLYANVKITVNGALQYQSTAQFMHRQRNNF